MWPGVESEGWWQGWRDRLEDGRKGSIITIYCKRGFVVELYISHPSRPIATRLILSARGVQAVINHRRGCLGA